MNILVLHAVIAGSSMDEDCGDICCFPTASSAMKYRHIGGSSHNAQVVHTQRQR